MTINLHVMIVTFTMDLDPMSFLGNPWGRQHGVVGDKWIGFETITLDNGRQQSEKKYKVAKCY